MALTDLERTANGYLVNVEDWNKEVAQELATEIEVELSDLSFMVIDYLRDEYINNNANQPNERNMVKGLKGDWPTKLDTKTLYTLFPKGPAKQAGKIAGLPETKRKGGY